MRIATGHLPILGALAELGMADRVVGIRGLRWISVPQILERVKSGQIVNVTGETHESLEPILAVQPDVWLTYYTRSIRTMRRIPGFGNWECVKYLRPTSRSRIRWVQPSG